MSWWKMARTYITISCTPNTKEFFLVNLKVLSGETVVQ